MPRRLPPPTLHRIAWGGDTSEGNCSAISSTMVETPSQSTRYSYGEPITLIQRANEHSKPVPLRLSLSHPEPRTPALSRALPGSCCRLQLYRRPNDAKLPRQLYV